MSTIDNIAPTQALLAAVADTVGVPVETVLEAYGASIATSFCESEARPLSLMKCSWLHVYSEGLTSHAPSHAPNWLGTSAAFTFRGFVLL